MYTPRIDYHRPTSLAAAAAILARDPEAKLLAGGHSLLPVLKLRLAMPSALVDLAGVRDLATGISAAEGSLAIGALTTHAEVAASPQVRAGCPLLAETAAQIGDRQVRNRGTIGGSIAHADPAADYPTALVALGATITTGGAAARDLPAEGFFLDLFTTQLGRAEIVTGVRVPTYGRGTGAVYLKHRHPASSYAVVGVAALLTVAGGAIASARLVVGGATANPARVAAAEAALLGRAPDAETFAAAAAEVAGALAEPLSDLYASADYRVHLAGVLARRALACAAERA